MFHSIARSFMTMVNEQEDEFSVNFGCIIISSSMEKHHKQEVIVNSCWLLRWCITHYFFLNCNYAWLNCRCQIRIQMLSQKLVIIPIARSFYIILRVFELVPLSFCIRLPPPQTNPDISIPMVSCWETKHLQRWYLFFNDSWINPLK